MTDTLKTIRNSSYLFFTGTLLSRLSGMLRDISMAYVFGTQSHIASFMVAFRFAHLLRRIFGEGALHASFIPEFENLRYQNETRAFTFFRDLTLILSCFLVLCIAMCCVFLGGCLKWGSFNPSNQELVYLVLLMMPSLLFICLYGLNSSFLHCEKSFFIPSVAPMAFNAIWIMSVFLLRHTPAKEAMPKLAIGVIIACFCQWALTVPQTVKSLKSILFSSIWSFQVNFTDLRRLVKPMTLGVFGIAASQINNAIDSLFAHFSDPEGPALLWYAIRIQQLPLALFGIAIAGAILPPLSRAYKAKQWGEYHKFLHDALSRTWTFIFPITAALFVMGDTFVQFLYGHGDFGQQSVIRTTYCLWAYGLGLIPSVLIVILAPACYAQNNYFFPACVSCITLVINLILNTVFTLVLGWGATSVALATSLSAWINFCFLAWNLIKSGTHLFSQIHLFKGIKVLLATLGALWGFFHFRMLYQELPFFSNKLFFSTFIEQLCFLTIQILFFGGLLTMCYLFLNLANITMHFLTKKSVKKTNTNN